MKGKKMYKKHARWLVLAIIFAVIMIILFVADGAIMGMGLAPTVNSYLHAESYKKVNASKDLYFTSDYKSADALQKEEDELCQQLEEEGAALLKNENNALPLAKGTKVSLFGASSYDFIYGGTGSGEVNTDNALTLSEALYKFGIYTNEALENLYEELDYHRETPFAIGGYSSDYIINEVPAGKIFNTGTGIQDTLKDYSTAIVTFSRSGGEGADLPYGNNVTGCEEGGPDSKDGDYLVLNDDEILLLKDIYNYKQSGLIKKIIVLVNSSNALQLDFVDNDQYGIDAVLWVGDVGQNGILGVASLLTEGNANPSGRIVDTFLNDNHSSPAMQNFGVYEYSNKDALGLDSAQNNMNSGITKLNSRYVVYEEGIYVGYKYYETRYEDYVTGSGNADNGSWSYSADVAYPFGSGLSYTDESSEKYTTGTWDYSDFSVAVNEKDSSKLDITLNVTNGTGMDGKHTVQIYMQSPYTAYDQENGVEKASVELVGFDKKSIAAGETAEYNITVDKSQLASYDSNKAEGYILEDGTFYFTAAHDAHEAVNNILAAKGYTPAATDSRMDAAGDAAAAGTIVVSSSTDDNPDIISSTDATLGVDITTFKTADAMYGNGSEVEITNQFDNADLNKYTGANHTVTYLSRKDWKETWPQAVTGFAVTEQMWEDGLASDDSSVGPDNKTVGSDARAALVDSYEKNFKSYYEEKYDTTITDVPEMGAEGDMKVYDMRGKDITDPGWDTLLNQATYAEMTNLIYNAFRQTVAIDSIALPGTTDYNGPQGLTNAITNGESGMAYTSEDVMAATYNLELVAKMGKCIGEDFLAADIAGIYGPGGNIHRTPYSGRNFEYYSEDGWLSGAIAETEVQAISSKGVMVFMKHCVLNDQENGRYGLSTFANEQAIREIYLKPFESAVKTGSGVGVMTSFNRIGVVWSGANFNFLTNVLRGEFGMDGISITDCSMFVPSMDYRLGVLSGQNIWDGMSVGMAQLDGYEDDAVMVTAVREAIKQVAYTVSGSLAMNNMDGNTTIKTIMPSWASGVLAAGVVLGVLVLLCIILYTRTAIKAARNRIEDRVDKHGNPTTKLK